MSARLPAPERRAALVDAALSVFSRDGYQATTMDAVAAAGGVTKPVLYQHWASKHDLFLELLATVGADLGDRVSQAVQQATHPHDQVAAGFRSYFAFVTERPDHFRLLFGDGVRSDSEFADVVLEVEQSIASFAADLIAIDGLEPDDRLTLAHGIVGLAEATGRHLVNAEHVDADRFAAQVTELAWTGLRGNPSR